MLVVNIEEVGLQEVCPVASMLKQNKFRIEINILFNNSIIYFTLEFIQPYNKIQKKRRNKIDFKNYLSIHDGEKEAASNMEGGSWIEETRSGRQ